jgi:hypothetical protein
MSLTVTKRLRASMAFAFIGVLAVIGVVIAATGFARNPKDSEAISRLMSYAGHSLRRWGEGRPTTSPVIGKGDQSCTR